MVGEVLVWATLLALPCGGSVADADKTIRSTDGERRLGTLLREGTARSATFRGLVGALSASDVIVHVVFVVNSQKRRAYLVHQVTATASRRYLRVAISIKMSDHDALHVLAHELQHALEVAQSPDVRNAEAMGHLFARIGYPTLTGGERVWETDAAIQIQQRVRAELESTPSCPS